MPPFAAFSLRTARTRLRADCMARLGAEYPDVRIELRPVVPEAPHLVQCYLEGREIGPVISLENLVGRSLHEGYDRVLDWAATTLSDAIMLRLQTE